MEEILDKMRELRDTRDLKILEKELKNINIDADYKKHIPNNKVVNVKYLGDIKWNEDEKRDIYLLIEQKENKNGELIEIEKLYMDNLDTDEFELLGGNNKGDSHDYILLSEKYKEQLDLLEKLQEIDLEGRIDLNEIEQGRLEEIAKQMGVPVEKLKKISEIDPKQEPEKEERSEYENDEEKEHEEDETLTKKEVEKVSSKTEIDTSQKITDKDTMESLLNVQDKGYKKIIVVYSDKISENNNSTRFSFMGIKEDGSAEKIDTLEQRYGKNPNKKIESINTDGTKIEEKQAQSIYQIKGKDEEQLAINIGQMGTIEASFVRTPNQDNQEAISIPIETHNIRPTTRETRELMNDQRNPRVKEEIDRYKEHKELNCNKVEQKDIDDDPNNNTHEHIDDIYIQKCVKEILKSDIVSSNYGRDFIKEKVIKEIDNMKKEKGYLDGKELIEELTNNLEEQSQNEHPGMEHDKEIG